MATFKALRIDKADKGTAATITQFDEAEFTSLTADADGTLMRWETEIHLSGLLERFAGGGVDGLSRRQANRTLDAVERAL